MIGDDGIVSKAQEANIKSGMAALEEYIQSFYVEHFENLNDIENKAEMLAIQSVFSNCKQSLHISSTKVFIFPSFYIGCNWSFIRCCRCFRSSYLFICTSTRCFTTYTQSY